MWLVNYAAAKIKPGLEVMDYDEFVANVLSDEPATQPKAEKKRTAEDIMADFAPIVAADKRKGG